MSLGGSKGGTSVVDPLAQQKTAAANTALNQYQSLIPSANQFVSTYMPQLGKSDFTSQTPQLLQDVFKAVQGDVEGTGGPFTSLKQNLLGNFDAGAQKFVLDPLKEQLIREGLYSSGPGMDVLGTQGEQLASQRGLLGSQIDTQLLNMAQNLGSQQFDINQLLGFSEPMQAFNTAASLQPPGILSSPIQTQYTPPQSSGFGSLLGSIAGQVIPAMLTGGASLPMTMGAAAAGGGSGLLGALGPQGNAFKQDYYNF